MMPKNNLPDFICALKKPEWKLIETHICYVLIGPRYTYKIKKPVKFVFVDFSTLYKRKHFCEEELRLNRRYSPSVYVGVSAINKRGESFDFAGKGRTVEYAVKMKTLPSGKILDQLLNKNKVTPRMIKYLAEEVWRFHRKAKKAGKSGRFGRPEHLQRIFELDFKGLASFKGRVISKVLFRKLHTFVTNFIASNRDLLLKRLRDGKIRDLHGDLHSHNIFYHKRPYIFDCIEFNPNFRYIDTAAEIGFLLMDLEFRKKKYLAEVFLDIYLKKSRDYEALKLLDFYKCHYAYVRGLVYSLSEDFKLARRYFQFSGKYAKAKPFLLAVGGLIGTGKSTLAKGLARKLRFMFLRSDRVRKNLAHLRPYAHPRLGFRKGIYTPSFTRKIYKALFSQTQKLLSEGKSVILDASFSKKVFRKWLIELARRSGADFMFIETDLSNGLILERLLQRRRDISDAGPALLHPFFKGYEPPKEIPVRHKFKIITSGSKKDTLSKALKMLEDRGLSLLSPQSH